jgi:hypothetical protein
VRFGLRTVRVRRNRETDLFLLGWFASFVAWSVSSLTGDYMLHSIRNGGLEMFAGFYIHWVFLGAAVGISRVGAERVVAREGMPNRPSAWMPDLAMARPHSWAEGRL